jgi:hypothetical protein
MQIEWSLFLAMRAACIETEIRSASHLKLLVQPSLDFGDEPTHTHPQSRGVTEDGVRPASNTVAWQ